MVDKPPWRFTGATTAAAAAARVALAAAAAALACSISLQPILLMWRIFQPLAACRLCWRLYCPLALPSAAYHFTTASRLQARAVVAPCCRQSPRYS